ncbi:MAG: hypothetical protein HYS98_00980 [Deltaproteobacteria bacterium]|nr:hypothetical protein [Deltaproteobacteria bacterium]
MKLNTVKKSSITLPPKELKLVQDLVKAYHAKSKVEIIRRGLYLLKEKKDKEFLSQAYHKASQAVSQTYESEKEDLDPLSNEGIDD